MNAPKREFQPCFSSRRLHLILFPTEACNFRCVYCYEEFRLRQMQPQVLRGVKNFLSRRAPGLHHLTLSWFGGEPLLARGIIEDVLEHVAYLKEAHAQLQTSSEITTNAYLLSCDVFRRLLARGVEHYQISFDGPREHHDRKRVRADGTATFDRIWENLKGIRAIPGEFTIMVRVHVDRENEGMMSTFLDEYGNSFGEDQRFELFFRPLQRFGGRNDGHLQVFEPDEAERVLDGLRSEADRRGLRQTAEAEESHICYAARANSFLIRADGRLNKCTVALEHPNNQVGRIQEDGSIELSTSLMAGWMRGLWSGDPVELECPMSGYAEPVRLDTFRKAGLALSLSPAPAAASNGDHRRLEVELKGGRT